MSQPLKINKTEKKAGSSSSSSYVFGKQNYQIMIAGLIIIALGFFLMSGSDDIFSSTKMTVAPLVVVLGFAVELFAILKKSSDNA